MSFAVFQFNKDHFDVLETPFLRQSQLDRENTTFFEAGHIFFKQSIQSTENQNQVFIETQLKIVKKRQLTRKAVARHRKKRGEEKMEVP